MRIGVVIPCYRQERWLPRTVSALEAALADRDWSGVIVRSAPSQAPLPERSGRWQVVEPPVSRRLTPGAARMLGAAACGGSWLLFVDADVEVDAGWVARACEAAGGGEAPAGLWGRIEEWFEAPEGVRPGSPDLYRIGDRPRAVDYLATLAFYRREALLRAGGYDARLRSEEDFELGLRLHALGLELRSIGGLAGRHWSGPRPSFAELGRRWNTGLCFGQGQVLRLYLGRRGLGRLLRRQALYFATLALWVLALPAASATVRGRDPVPVALWALLPLAVLAVMTARKRSPRLALHSLLAWTLNGLGLLVGLFLLREDLDPTSRGGAAC